MVFILGKQCLSLLFFHLKHGALFLISRLKRVVWNPAEEVAALRAPAPIATLPMSALKPGTAVRMAAATAGDIELFFKVPTAAATLAVTLGTGQGSCFLDFVPGAKSAHVGFNATGKGHRGVSDAVPMLGDETFIQMRVLIDGRCEIVSCTHLVAFKDQRPRWD